HVGHPTGEFSAPVGVYGLTYRVWWISSKFVCRSTSAGAAFKNCSTTKTLQGWKTNGTEDSIYTSLSAVPGGKIYAGAFDIGVMRSDDNGTSWNQISDSRWGWSDGKGGNSLSIVGDPSGNAHVWAALQNNSA